MLAALALPAMSLAGGSAGDQQYTDPFSGGSGSTSHTSTAPTPTHTATPTPAPATATPTSAATTAEPTATMASTPADPVASTSTLPNTGYDLWTAGGFGLMSIGAGLLIRRRARRT